MARPSALLDTRIIYCGDCLDQLKQLPDGSIDLCYIDPPFNSNRNYEVFWGETKELRSFEDRHESTRAYIEYMRPRCIQIRRVLKTSGSFYYHCDWHASHYVKVMLDQIFGEGNFINEIIWKRQSAHNDAKQGSKHLGRVHDTLFLYTGGGAEYHFKHLYKPYDDLYLEKFYKHVEPETGRRYQLGDLGAPGGAAPAKEIHTMSSWASPATGGTAANACRSSMSRVASCRPNPVPYPASSATWTKATAYHSGPYGTIFHPCKVAEVRASATPHRNR